MKTKLSLLEWNMALRKNFLSAECQHKTNAKLLTSYKNHKPCVMSSQHEVHDTSRQDQGERDINAQQGLWEMRSF